MRFRILQPINVHKFALSLSGRLDEFVAIWHELRVKTLVLAQNQVAV